MTSMAAATQVVPLSASQTRIEAPSQDLNGVTIKLEMDKLNFTDVATKGGDFTLLSIMGFSRSFEIGEPNLPRINKILSVPFGAELDVQVVSYEVEEYSLTDLGITNPLMPVQPSLSKSDDPETVPFEINDAIYRQSGWYQLPLAEGQILGTMRSLHLGLVSISPIEYNPSENTIRVYNNIEVRVNFIGGDYALTEEMQNKYYSPFFEPAYNRVINYSSMQMADKGDLVTYPVRYVIISDRMFEAQLQPFIEWKTKKGFNVEVYYTDVIGSTTSAIQTFLENLYLNSNPPSDPAPSFILFCGDDQQIPATDMGSHISDLPFCEYSTPSDNFPEVYYGRFSAQNTTQMQPQIDKTLEYEQYLMPDPSYLGEVTLIAGVDASHAPTYGNGQINYGTNYYFNAAHGITSNTWLYPASDGAGASDAIIQEVQDGIGLMNYTAHCGHDSQSDPNFNTTDIAGLSNIHKYGLGIGNCCEANTFGSDYSTPCFGEAWMQKENGGGIGYIGGSNSTYWDEDYWWGVGNGPIVGAGPTYEETGIGAYDGAFHDHGEDDSLHYITNGALIFAGNMAVTEAGSSRIAYYWQIYHLMGDPSVMTYLGVPLVNTYSLPSTLLITDNSMTVDADPGSYIGVSRDGVLHGSGYVDESGTVTFDFEPFTIPGEIDVVITCQNRQPVIATLMVIAPDGPYVIYDSHDINDISGNNDGNIDIGENILVGMTLKNVGPDDALNVEAKIRTEDTYITITDSTESFGTIFGNDGTGYVADGFAFDVAGNTPDDHSVTFDVVVEGDQRITWNSKFTVKVKAPDVGFISVDVNDASGNGNGILDPGESAELTVTLHNSGTGQAGNLNAVLSEFDTFVGVPDPNSFYGTILGGASGDNAGDVFVVNADVSCPMGYAMQFQLDLSGDGGYTKTLYFDFTVGDRVVIYFDDFSYDQGWTGLGGSGEWMMSTCVGGTGGNGVGDPTADHTGTTDNMALGNDMNPGTSAGDYSNGLTQTYWVYSPVIDCEDYTSILMTYYHWLGIESSSYDHAYFEVFDGSSWVTLYQNGATMDEGAWIESSYDLSAYAEENPLFQIRFGLGNTDGSQTYCGWNIDDIELKGYYNGNDYKVRVQPESQSQYGPAGDLTTYALTVRNRGAFFDDFTLANVGDWDVTFYDEADENEINSTGNVGSLDSIIILAKVAVPAGTPLHDFNNNLIVVTSQGNPLACDTATLITYSAGTPALVPWLEDFPGSTLYMQRWFSNAGAAVNDDGVLPPSPPYSLNFDGLGDTVVTQLIDLTGQDGVRLSYYYERGGSGDPTEAGENLWIDYRNSTGNWVNLQTHLGADTTMSQFEYVNVELPTDALHNSLQLRFRSLGSASGNDDWYVDDIMLDYPPVMSIEPGSMSEYLNQGESAEGQMIIANSGDGKLFYDINVQYYLQADSKFAQLQAAGMVEPASQTYPEEAYIETAKGEENSVKGSDVTFNAGGPDTYGYYWMDSDEAGGPSFSWVDITSTGTDVTSQLDDDNAIGPFDIGFDFPYYGNTYNQFWIGSNGIIGFSDATMSSRAETPLPTSSTPNNIIAWMWDDLNIDDADNPGGQALYKSDGEQLVVQFNNYPIYRADPGEVITAEIIIDFKGNIKIQYLGIGEGFTTTGATVGIENADGTDGLTVVYHAAYLHEDLAVQFSKPYEWISLDATSGDVEAGEADTIACTFTTEEDLDPGMYYADVKVKNNDPAQDMMMVVNAQMEVVGVAPYLCGDASGDGMVNVSDAVYIINYVFSGGTAPDPLAAADVNCDTMVNVSDAVVVINYVFSGGYPPCDTDNNGQPDC